MPYVRKRGNQVLIVHGVRDPETRAVEQRVLFTFYTRDEARSALGQHGQHQAATFHDRMARRYPDLRFDWKTLDEALARLMPELPEESADGGTRHSSLRSALSVFSREVVLALGGEAPALLQEAGGLRPQLLVFQEMLGELLAAPAGSAAEQGPHLALSPRGRQVPLEVEERWEAVFNQGDLQRAEAAFSLLTWAFEDYAEGHNYLGLIALDRGRHDEAAEHFQRTMEVGRRVLPRRVARDRWWADLATRPYMRGLRNLILSRVRAERYDEALAACDQLESECYDSITATTQRAAVWLCTKQWTKALEASLSLQGLYPTESLLASFAAFELGRDDEARAWLLHATLNAPHTVAVVLGEQLPAPSTSDEARNYRSGGDLRHNLRGFLRHRSAASKKFFSTLWRSELFGRLRLERESMASRWEKDRTGRDRAAFDRLRAMESLAFASQAVGLPPRRTPSIEGASRRRPRSRGPAHRCWIH